MLGTELENVSVFKIVNSSGKICSGRPAMSEFPFPGVYYVV